MKVKFKMFSALLMCLLLFQGCVYDSPIPEYSLRTYSSSGSVKNMFVEYKSEFIAVAKLLQVKQEFFYQNDNCLFPRKNYKYSTFFTESEWQNVRNFLSLTGLLNIRLDTVEVGENEGNMRYGEKIAFRFSVSQPGVRCSLVFLSSFVDMEIKNKMIDSWYALHSKLNVVEMEELGEGWFLFTHYELPDD